MLIHIGLGPSVQGGPFGFVLEKAHGLNILQKHIAMLAQLGSTCVHERVGVFQRVSYVLLIRRESMVYAGGQDNHVVLLEPDAHPVVGLASDVKVTRAVADVSDLLVFVEVFGKEHFDLVLVYGAHGVGGHGDDVPVFVVAVFGDGVDFGYLGAVVVQDAEAGEVRGVDVAAGVVGLALVALFVWDGGISHIYSRGACRRVKARESYTYLLVVEPVCPHDSLRLV